VSWRTEPVRQQLPAPRPESLEITSFRTPGRGPGLARARL